ncbi:MAG: hypothetical protein HQ495_14155 [Alphaproteobacteria bacterium]|nr:hypothetical protein [Alphaproteobacteria bacterium]
MNRKWRTRTLIAILVTGFSGTAVADHVTPQIRQIVEFGAESGKFIHASRPGQNRPGAIAIGVPNANGAYRLIFLPAGAPGRGFPQDRLKQFGQDTAANGNDVTLGARRNDGKDRLATFVAAGQEIFAVADSLDIEDFVPVVRRNGIDIVGIDPFSKTTHVALQRLHLNTGEFHGPLNAQVTSASGTFAMNGPNGKTLRYSVAVAAADACGATKLAPKNNVDLTLNGNGAFDLCFRIDPASAAVPGGQYVSKLTVKVSDR